MVREKRHSYIVVALIVLFGMVGFSVAYSLFDNRKLHNEKPGSTVAVTGIAICLPHKDTSDPQTMECGIGIKDTSGKYYALNMGSGDISTLPMNQAVTIEGTFENVSESIYPIEGSIRVTKIDKK